MRASKEVRAIQASLAEAGDAQVAQIVAMVDALAHRGDADALVAALRPRLTRLRPARRIGFTRLLFMPIDALLVPGPAWQRGSLSVPRTVLPPLAAVLREHLPEDAARAEGPAARPATEAALAALGAPLWPRAAAILDTMPPPADWTAATGLTEGDHAILVAHIAAVLGVANEIQALCLPDAAMSDEALCTILGRTAPRGAPALSAVVAVLLARLSGSGRIIPLATEAAGSNPAAAVDAAVEHALDTAHEAAQAEAETPATLHQATLDAAQTLKLLAEVEPSAAARPSRKRRIDRVRRAADLLCRERFGRALQDELLCKLDLLPAQPDDGAVLALEATARGLRHLEAQGRQLGEAEHYEAALRGALPPFDAAAHPLTLEDRVRLVEILGGPVEALKRLEPSSLDAS